MAPFGRADVSCPPIDVGEGPSDPEPSYCWGPQRPKESQRPVAAPPRGVGAAVGALAACPWSVIAGFTVRLCSPRCISKTDMKRK